MTLAGPVLIVEPYFGGSHRAWAEGLRDHLGIPAHLITLPARWWKWRMRGAAVTMAEACAALEHRPEVVLVSDMIDLAAFRTFARPHLGDVPMVFYFHESQLTYPDSPQMESDLHFAVTNWLSALAADRVLFNSHYHRQVFFEEMPRLLRHFPDHTHEHRLAEVEARSEVIEVGVDLSWVSDERPERGGPIRFLWNHRWEHDKDPETFFAAVDEVAATGRDFELVVCGESFRQRPAEFTSAADRHGGRLVHIGFLPRPAYLHHLLRADVVVSTARQEFFGVSVIEAMAAGCFPLLPRRLSYPELVPSAYHDLCLYAPGDLARRMSWTIDHVDEVRATAGTLAPLMSRYGWPEMAPRYRRALAAGQLSATDRPTTTTE